MAPRLDKLKQVVIVQVFMFGCFFAEFDIWIGQLRLAAMNFSPPAVNAMKLLHI